MEENLQFLPTLQEMCTQEYPVGNWVMFYKNTWLRKVVANTIDVQTDMALKATDPEQSVEYGSDAMGNPIVIAVKHRLELRKVELGKAIKILEAIKALDGLTVEGLTEKYWSEDALKMDPAVAAEALGTKEPATVQYIVIADGGVTLNGTEDVTPKGTAIMLDPTDPETAALLEAGTIELATADNTQQEQEQQQETAPAQQQYKFLVDFGTEKAGDTIMLPTAGWTPEQVAERVADGSIALVVTGVDTATADQQQQEQQDAAPAVQNYNVVTDITVDGVTHAAGTQVELHEDQVKELPEGSVTLA
jgi:hypothetical protein